jgi:hypothetical protein
MVLTSSCGTTKLVNQKYPIIPMPNRPSISPELNEDDFKEMARYATKLEIGIKEYNKYAEEQNKKIEEHFQNR